MSEEEKVDAANEVMVVASKIGNIALDAGFDVGIASLTAALCSITYQLGGTKGAFMDLMSTSWDQMMRSYEEQLRAGVVMPVGGGDGNE